MKALKQYEIEFKGLADGSHTFNYVIEKEFFNFCEYEGVNQAHVEVVLTMEKSERLLDLWFTFKGTIELPCDRCLEWVSVPIEGQNRLVVRIGSGETINEDEDFIELPEKAYKIDVSPYIYENMVLALPMQILHPDDEQGNSTCNPEMLQHLTVDNEKPNHDSNPLWDALKNVKLD